MRSLKIISSGKEATHNKESPNRTEATSFIIIESSVKNTDIAEEKGYDEGKKISGIKRHVALNTEDFSHAIPVPQHPMSQIELEHWKHLLYMQKT